MMLRQAVSLMLVPLACAQVPSKFSTDLKFEVASIRPAAPGQQNSGIRPAPGGERYVANNATLSAMLTAAYRVRPDQIVGGPSWINDDRFDMNAKAEKQSSADELHAMLVNLLVDRFQLKFHREKRDMAMYALTVDKGGAKLKSNEASNGGEPWIDQRQEQILHVKMQAKFCPMDYFAFRLSTILDRPVVDLTDLQGGFDFDFFFTRQLPPEIPDTAIINGAPIDTSGPTVFAAVKQQLGLELKAQKGPVEVIVIDSATKLTSN
jgi:uncharacterized protein (TIGR03435 family)